MKNENAEKLLEAMELLSDATLDEAREGKTHGAKKIESNGEIILISSNTTSQTHKPRISRLPKIQYAGLAAAAVLLIVGTVVLFNVFGRDGEDPLPPSTSDAATSDKKPSTTNPTQGQHSPYSVLSDPGNNPIEPLSAAREKQILEAYATYLNATRVSNGPGRDPAITAADLTIHSHYGTFNGNDVVTVFGKDWGGTADMKYVVVDGHMIVALGSGSYDVVVFDGESIVDVHKAYELGLLKQNDLRSMVFQRLRNSYANQLYWNENDSSSFDEAKYAKLRDSIVVLNYYGNSESGDIVTFWYRDNDFGGLRGMDDAPRTLEIAGYTFILESASLDLLIQTNWFECIKEEYERGYISKSVIENLWEKYFSNSSAPTDVPDVPTPVDLPTTTPTDVPATTPTQTTAVNTPPTDEPPTSTATTTSAPQTPNRSPSVSPNHAGNGAAPTLSAAREKQILEAYAAHMNLTWTGGGKITADMLEIHSYFGTFNGNDVIVVYGKEWAMDTAMQPIVINGYLVADLPSGSLALMVFDGNRFIEIHEAYRQGMLRDEDLRTMTFQRLRHAYAMQLYWESSSYSGNFNERRFREIYNNIYVHDYYGRTDFGDVVSFWFRDRTLTSFAISTEIGGYLFPSTLGLDIMIQSNYFECIKEEYERGHIPKSVISELYEKWFR